MISTPLVNVDVSAAMEVTWIDDVVLFVTVPDTFTEPPIVRPSATDTVTVSAEALPVVAEPEPVPLLVQYANAAVAATPMVIAPAAAASHFFLRVSRI